MGKFTINLPLIYRLSALNLVKSKGFKSFNIDNQLIKQ